MITLNAEQVANKEYEQYDPERYDFWWQADGSVVIVELLWWDDASYATYQGDPY